MYEVNRAAEQSARIETLTAERLTARRIRVDRMFAVLLVLQWIAMIGTALVLSPYAWAGRERAIHFHVWIALVGGGGIILLPVLLAWLKPGATITRHVIAAAQMLSSALLIHLSGGRIETHFHVFGSLAFLAFYLDWPVLITATVVVAADHFLRGMFWPESVFGTVNAEWWRFLEHAGWVVFEDIFLIWSCVVGRAEAREAAVRQVEIEQLSEQEQLKSAALEMALAEMGASA
jgi:hypothetical protein